MPAKAHCLFLFVSWIRPCSRALWHKSASTQHQDTKGVTVQNMCLSYMPNGSKHAWTLSCQHFSWKSTHNRHVCCHTSLVGDRAPHLCLVVRRVAMLVVRRDNRSREGTSHPSFFCVTLINQNHAMVDSPESNSSFSESRSQRWSTSLLATRTTPAVPMRRTGTILFMPPLPSRPSAQQLLDGDGFDLGRSATAKYT